ncbi:MULTISPECIES: DUF1800 domain-containing protein [unclassified Sphingobium]|uniref:DUF1800 domain-containing protein n=1 Tax=unclassified Sphingobium TaxID=2611147 RepID=UPI0011999C95|nr:MULTISPECIES: DUF1800 domain-containing protein [unclassified Sphingobium]TWD19047.1 uncharacterized protein (DUF1800 family) [Sphingobium sp. AEW013]
MKRCHGGMICAAASLLLCAFSSDIVSAATNDATMDMRWANRLTWGATSLNSSGGSVDRWLSGQLGPASDPLPPEAAAQIAAMQIEKTPMPQLAQEMLDRYHAFIAMKDLSQREAARIAYEKGMNALADEARRRFVLRALYAPDQLREQMTWFWFNHFNVFATKRDIRAMVGDYEDVLRAHALGRFRDLLEATLRHPAMLRYLDNDLNTAGHINENYAREIMELHSMGVRSGYNQKDVQELARILTGVGVRIGSEKPVIKPQWQPLYIRSGLFEFNPAKHDFGDKIFLGHAIKGTGMGEVEQALDLIASSPATARHVSGQIATFFMGDDPPAVLVQKMAQTFQQSGGDIAQVMRIMIDDPAFAASLGKGFKNPVQYAISALRLSYGDHVIMNVQPVVSWINHMGGALYGHQTPDGYGMTSDAWSSPGQMTARFDIARQIGIGAGGIFRNADGAPPVFPAIRDRFYHNGSGNRFSATTKAALAKAVNDREWNILFLSSPEFMYR